MSRRVSMRNHKETITGKSSTNKDSIEYLIESPIRCGFLLVFCEKEFNIESLSFLMDIMRYRDIFVDRSAWATGWKELDTIYLKELENTEYIDESKDFDSWPSRIVNKSAVLEYTKILCDNYLVDNSPKEICLSMEIRERTMRRVKLIDYYGPDVFMEATIDPIKTMRRDILPRFLASELYQKMQQRLQSCNPLPAASDLTVPPPDKRLIDTISSEELLPTRKFELKEILECNILYTEFLTYLRTIVSSENLICLRMLTIFENLIQSDDDDDGNAANDFAWEVYRYFVASGSAYEISLSYAHRKLLMISLAKPTIDTFVEVKKSALTMLRSNFESYKNTPQYDNLATLLKTRKYQEEHPPYTASSTFSAAFNCFGK